MVMEKKIAKGRAPCCDKSKVKKGPWSPAEDLRLVSFIKQHGHSNWRALPKQAGLLRCGKSCRLRWINYLSPDVKRGNYTPEEEQIILNLHSSIGNKWSKIASYLPGRTDNEIKNHWNTHLKKRVIVKKTKANSKATGTDHPRKGYSGSPMSTSSTLTESGDHQNTEKSRDLQELEVKKPDETSNYDSPTSFASNVYESMAIIQENGSQDEEIFIPIEPDIELWELLDTLDPIQSNGATQNPNASNPEEKFDRSVDCSEWLRILENELGLTNENDNLPNEENMTPTTQLNQGNKFETETSPMFDDFPIWDGFSQNFNI